MASRSKGAKLRRLMRELQGRRWRAEDARQVLAAWRESGESGRAFGRRYGFDAQRLSWWRKRLEGGEGTKADESATRFIPATLVETLVARPAREAAIVVRLGGEVTVEIDSAAVSPSWLAALLGELSRS
jgi:hypothetical protein